MRVLIRRDLQEYRRKLRDTVTVEELLQKRSSR